jgi:glycosyltransferase involved in cell wall biosynthesis
MVQALRRRLLSVGHSYVVGLNRRLAHEMARAGQGRWEVTAVAPKRFLGRNDLRSVRFEPLPGEACPVVPARAYLTRYPHLFFYGRRLRALLREPWDLVHCWQEPYTLSGGQVAWLTPPHVPFVFWTAQNVAKDYPPPFCWFEEYCLDRCSGWLSCGRTTEEVQLARGYGTRPHQIIPLGVATDHFRPDPAAGASTRRGLGWAEPGPPIVGFLGRFQPEKGLALLMRTLDKLRSPWRALLVGEGPLEGTLRAWANRHGQRARVVTGVTHDEVPRYLNAMDVLCAPSQTAGGRREQQGRMLIEAFACGLPVVSSDAGEIPYVVAEAGVVVPEKEERAWETTLSRMLESPKLRRELSACGRTRAMEVYAWPVIGRKYLTFFEELLERYTGERHGAARVG